MNASNPTVAVLATMNTKHKEARFVAEMLVRAGATPWVVDLSMKSHDVPGADVTGAHVAEAAGASWLLLNERPRQEAAAVVIEGGTRILLEKLTRGEIAGAIGVGGANGTDLVCSILRPLPYLVPKVMVSAVAGTAAVQWCVAESDICMYPSIGDVSNGGGSNLVAHRNGPFELRLCLRDGGRSHTPVADRQRGRRHQRSAHTFPPRSGHAIRSGAAPA